MSLKKALVPVLLAISSSAGLHRVLASDDAVAEFSGLWLRDEAASEDPVAKLEESSPQGQSGGFRRPSGAPSGPSGGWTGGRGQGNTPPGQGSGQGGRGGRAPGGGPRGGRPGSSERSPEQRAKQFADAIAVLDIRQFEDRLEIRNANRETRVVFLDGRVLGDGFGYRTEAYLEGTTLRVTTDSPAGVRIERFELADGALRVTTEIDEPLLSGLSFRTVYRRTESGSDHSTKRITTAAPATGDAVADAPVAEFAVVATAPATSPRGADAVGPAGDVPAAPVAEPVGPATEPAWRARSTVVRVVPPESNGRRLVTGREMIGALPLDSRTARIEFFLDGELVDKKALPPYEAKLDFAQPAREQVVRVVAYDEAGTSLGSDELVVNRLNLPFSIRITALQPISGRTSARLRALVTKPRDAVLDKVTFFLNDNVLGEVTTPPFEMDVPMKNAGPRDFARVVAKLSDGRELEDVVLLQGANFAEKVDVQLVALQVLVTDRAGNPIDDLGAEELEIIDGGKARDISSLNPAPQVKLLLGLSVDSSGSMVPLWPRTRAAAEVFIEQTLLTGDRAFLIDFDSGLRLVQEPTGDTERLRRSFNRLRPSGGTALYDSMIFGMLQFDGEVGRRALVVITDGFDSDSRANPARVIELGKSLGVPVYVIAMNIGRGASPGLARASADGFFDPNAARNNLRLITEPTGGRLYQANAMEQVESAFAQISAELRKQYILTFYTDRSLDQPADTEIRVKRKGLKVKTALPLELVE